MLREQRAIVTDTPGTTRDYLEENWIRWLPPYWWTLLVCEAQDPIEKEGDAVPTTSRTGRFLAAPIRRHCTPAFRCPHPGEIHCPKNLGRDQQK